MALTFSHLSWWLLSGKKKQQPKVAKKSSLNSSLDSGLWESDNLKFPSVSNGHNVASRRVKRRWHSREERKIDKEYDLVLVPSDGGCVSGTESDDSDYSIGWLEPHGPEFQSDDDMENSFAVLVRCYAHPQTDVVADSEDKAVGPIVNMPNLYPDEKKKYIEELLSTLQNN